MTAKSSPAATVGSVVVTLAAVLAGRFLGWAFGLSFVLPLVVALLTTAALRRRSNPFAEGAGLHAALVTFSLLTLVVTALRGEPHLGPVFVALKLVSIGGLVWLVARPGPAPAGLLLTLHAYYLLMDLMALPGFITAMPQFVRTGAVDQLVSFFVPLALSVSTVVFLGRAMAAELSRRGASAPAA
ncbi:MAG: hypothetical protein SFW67_02590 [Myxococcaceae bacterium]|nr:hypothetical protein [Myxococcaceae bacterium]